MATLSQLDVFQQFSAGGGTFTLSRNTRIVLDAGATNLAANLEGAQGWVQKLRLATGLDLPVVVGGAAQVGDIVLSSGATDALKAAAGSATFSWNRDTKNIGENVRNEGFSYNASASGLSITYLNQTGALRGLQTVASLLTGNGQAAGAHRDLPTGTGIDYPDFATRGVMVDVGRKFVSVKDLLGLMDEMSASKLNTLHLHLSDNVDAEKGAGGANGYLRLYDDSEPDAFKVLKPKDSPSDGADRTYYTKEDIKTLEEAGARLGIEIVPEIDSPGHSRVFTNAFPEFLNDPASGIDPSVIDVNNPKAVAYVTDAIKEFAGWFSSKKFHVGGDEPYGLPTADLNNYLETLRKNLQAAGIGTDQIGAWNNWGENTISLGSGNDEPGKGYMVDVWYPTPKEGLAGKDWLDISNDRYYVPGVKPNGDGTISYNSFGETGAKAYQTVIDALNKSGISSGGELGIWNDQAEAFKYGFDTINTGIAEALPALGYAYWHGIPKDKDGNPVSYQSIQNGIQAGMLEFESMRVRERFPYMTADQALQLLKDTAGYKGFSLDPATGRPTLVKGDVASYGATDPFGYDPAALAEAAKGPVLFRDGTYVANLDGRTGGASASDTWSNAIGTKDSNAAAALASVDARVKQLQSSLPTQDQITGFLADVTAAKGDFYAVFAVFSDPKWSTVTGLLGSGFQWYDQATFEPLPPAKFSDAIAAALSSDQAELASLTAQEITLRQAADHDYVGTLQKLGPGTLKLTGTNTFLGGVKLDGGRLVVDRDVNLGAASGSLSFNGGSLVLDGSFDLAPTRAVMLDAGGGTFDTNGHDMTLASAVAGQGRLAKQGAGTLVLDGAGSTYSGGTALTGGTLELATSGAAGTGAISFGDGSQRLVLDAAAFTADGSFANTVVGLGAGDTVDFRGLNAAKTTVTYGGGILTVSDGTRTERLKLGTPGSTSFYVTNDGAGSALVNVRAPDVVTASLVAPASVSDPSATRTASGSFGFTHTGSAADAVSVRFDAARSSTAAAVGFLVPVLSQEPAGGAPGEVGWVYKVADSQIAKLNAGRSLAEVFDVTVDDHHGGTTTQAVTITLMGSRPAAAPVVTGRLANDTGASATDRITRSAALTGSGDAFATVHFTADGKALTETAQADANGAWTYTPAGLKDGSHLVTANEANTAGTGQAMFVFTLDTAPPVPTAPGVSFATDQATLSGLSSPNSTVTVLDGGATVGSAKAGADGRWSLASPLSGAPIHRFTETATDLAGNVGASTGVTLLAPAGHAALTGGSGDDVLIGRPGNTLTGGAGRDTFVFTPGFGRETVTDFTPSGAGAATTSGDVLDLAHTLFADFGAVMAHARQVGADTLITADPGNVITLKGTQLAALHAQDFHFT